MKETIIAGQMVGFIVVVSVGFLATLRGLPFRPSAFVTACLSCTYCFGLFVAGALLQADAHVPADGLRLFPEPIAVIALVPAACIHGMLGAGLGVLTRRAYHRWHNAWQRHSTAQARPNTGDHHHDTGPV